MGAPLFRDPIHDGAADPTLIYNRGEGAWWMVYTNRRANAVGPRQSWFHGTDLGVASSTDQGETWTYRGTLPGLEFEFGRNTFWAPEILWHDAQYHMYCSYIRGMPAYSGNDPRTIHHYTSSDLISWHHHGPIALDTRQAIDACVHRLPDGRWRLWYKDSVAGSHTYAADSHDLYAWRTVGPAITDGPHEGPNVFELDGKVWMIVDGWDGQHVYRSDDFTTWTSAGTLLSGGGSRRDDQGPALHADVVVTGEEAEIFYFTHPERTGRTDGTGLNEASYADRRSTIQSATIRVDGNRLVCDRDAEHRVTLGQPTDA
ncbi:family 43 glycosylhydrolase [Georgenia halophila]|uniref:Family 43 glycosylhydrolase n=1 Tax=Georgenia halophila TaxID=620889 RepID=A0ABP8LI08_9MICO